MTLKEFTQAFNAAFTERQKNGSYEYINDADGLPSFVISIKEEELSFGEAMGYAREKERPVIDPVDAIYEACYCDGDSLDDITILIGNFPGMTDAEQLRNLLDAAFARDEEQAEDWP